MSVVFHANNHHRRRRRLLWRHGTLEAKFDFVFIIHTICTTRKVLDLCAIFTLRFVYMSFLPFPFIAKITVSDGNLHVVDLIFEEERIDILKFYFVLIFENIR